MIEVLVVYLGMAFAISFITIQNDRKEKLKDKIFKGYKEYSFDRDKDGFIQEGTIWERPAPKKKGKK